MTLAGIVGGFAVPRGRRRIPAGSLLVPSASSTTPPGGPWRHRVAVSVVHRGRACLPLRWFPLRSSRARSCRAGPTDVPASVFEGKWRAGGTDSPVVRPASRRNLFVPRCLGGLLQLSARCRPPHVVEVGPSWGNRARRGARHDRGGVRDEGGQQFPWVPLSSGGYRLVLRANQNFMIFVGRRFGRRTAVRADWSAASGRPYTCFATQSASYREVPDLCGSLADSLRVALSSKPSRWPAVSSQQLSLRSAVHERVVHCRRRKAVAKLHQPRVLLALPSARLLRPIP